VRTTRTTPSGTPPDDVPPHDVTPDDAPPKAKGVTTGRNLPAAIGVGVALVGGALITLFTVKATFLIYMGLALGIGLHELDGALRTRQIRIPVIPVLLGGAAMVTSAYWAAGGAVAASFALTLIAVLGWRLFGGAEGYVKDVTGAIFATAYLALPGATVAAMLAAADGP
jgi:phosphatidate cytidylyltransferase